MFAYHPMTLLRALLLLFVGLELIMVVALLIRGIASVIPLAIQGASLVYSLVY